MNALGISEATPEATGRMLVVFLVGCWMLVIRCPFLFGMCHKIGDSGHIL